MNALVFAFRNSCRGLIAAARSERAVRQELFLLILAVPMAAWLSPHPWVRVGLIGSIVFVLAVECLNTAVEKLCDHVNPDHHPKIGLIKDAGSAAVLCALLLVALVWGVAALEALGL